MSETPTAKKDVPKGYYILPNLFTTGTLFSGFFAMVSAMNGKFHIAAWMILVAGVFDGLDGKVARLTNTSSRFGVEYDSLADVVAFGVAPGLLMYSWALQPFGKWGWAAAFCYVACGALRLARFNVQSTTADTKYFVGMPIPGAAAIAATCILIFYELGGEGTVQKWSILFLVVLLAALMVSKVPYYSFKDPELFKRQPFYTLVAAIVLIAVFAAKPEIMLFITGFTYMTIGIVLWVLRLRKMQDRLAKTDDSDGRSSEG